MRLDQQGHALHRRGVGAFPPLGQSLLDQLRNIRQLTDASAVVALAAKIIPQPRAICRLRKHPGQRELPQPARSAEEHSVGHAFGLEHAPQHIYDLLIADKFREWHVAHPMLGAGYSAVTMEPTSAQTPAAPTPPESRDGSLPAI